MFVKECRPKYYWLSNTSYNIITLRGEKRPRNYFISTFFFFFFMVSSTGIAVINRYSRRRWLCTMRYRLLKLVLRIIFFFRSVPFRTMPFAIFTSPNFHVSQLPPQSLSKQYLLCLCYILPVAPPKPPFLRKLRILVLPPINHLTFGYSPPLF